MTGEKRKRGSQGACQRRRDLCQGGGLSHSMAGENWTEKQRSVSFFLQPQPLPQQAGRVHR